MSTRIIGDRGEEVAAEFLEQLGYRILERNYRFERAEVDIVCFEPAQNYRDGGQVVFVEVKTRSGLGFGHPEEAVTKVKQRKIMKAAGAFLYERRLEGSPCRFDVVSILAAPGEEPEIEHFKHAFF
jgi:putative endonuclease